MHFTLSEREFHADEETSIYSNLQWLQNVLTSFFQILYFILTDGTIIKYYNYKILYILFIYFLIN